MEHAQGVGHDALMTCNADVYHEVPLIIIILKVVLLPFDDDILYTDDCIQSFL